VTLRIRRVPEPLAEPPRDERVEAVEDILHG